jgi:uncharacterized protein YkwD
MKRIAFAFFIAITSLAKAQLIDSLNTAKNCFYMKVDEREMIYEINCLRSNPKSYLRYIQPKLDEARQYLKKYGKGLKNYSLTYSYTTNNGQQRQTIDTTWHNINEEEVKALTTLVNDLKKLKRLSVLKADSGVYNAARKHAKDQDDHEWKLRHTGSDGSESWDRITQFSPSMSFGNENIAGSIGLDATPRGFIIQLLVDSGIPGYGHRYNILDPQWTHIGCVLTDYKGMNWCIQNFGKKKE